MSTNAVIFNTICDLQNQATKLYQYFIKRASTDNFRWLMYALFLSSVRTALVSAGILASKDLLLYLNIYF